MGNATIGGKSGLVIGPFTAAGQDTGPIVNSGSLNPAWPTYPLYLPTIPVPFDGMIYALGFRGFTKHTFQLTGTGTGLQITVYYTLDRATAEGSAVTPMWTPVVAPADQGTYTSHNPLTQLTPDPSTPAYPVGASLYAQGPIVAFRLVSSAQVGGTIAGSVSVLLHSAQ